MTHSNVTQSCPYSPQTGPVGYLPAPNIFPLAKKTFAKGKMFWTKKIQELKKKRNCQSRPQKR